MASYAPARYAPLIIGATHRQPIAIGRHACAAAIMVAVVAAHAASFTLFSPSEHIVAGACMVQIAAALSWLILVATQAMVALPCDVNARIELCVRTCLGGCALLAAGAVLNAGLWAADLQPRVGQERSVLVTHALILLFANLRMAGVFLAGAPAAGLSRCEAVRAWAFLHAVFFLVLAVALLGGFA